MSNLDFYRGIDPPMRYWFYGFLVAALGSGIAAVATILQSRVLGIIGYCIVALGVLIGIGSVAWGITIRLRRYLGATGSADPTDQ